ncbi:Sec-independent protein translocase protein TatB [subsurface metagenome]
MDFFGIGTGEILLILVVALIIWGPNRLPQIARTMGKTVRALKKATYDLTSEVTKEIDIKEKDNPPQPRQDSGTKPKHS